MKSQINILQLVYPPISNQEAEWLKDDQEVQEEIKNSNLYMICQRAEAFFKYTSADITKHFTDDGIFRFSLNTQDFSTSGEIDIFQLLKLHNVDLERNEIEIELGPKLFRFWRADKATGDTTDVIDWFTTEKILFDKYHGHPALTGLDNYRKFTKYFLHYVGISKKEDSLTRLVIRPHDKRLRVLSNEEVKTDGSRLTDEVILLFFTVNPLQITQIETDEEFSELANGVEIDLIPIVADAEKAYVKILNSEYNTVKYNGYPKGSDGLYNTGLTRYGYLIGEDISIITDTDTIEGKHISDSVGWPSTMDFIFICGDEVTLIKAKEQRNKPNKANSRAQ